MVFSLVWTVCLKKKLGWGNDERRAAGGQLILMMRRRAGEATQEKQKNPVAAPT